MKIFYENEKKKSSLKESLKGPDRNKEGKPKNRRKKNNKR